MINTGHPERNDTRCRADVATHDHHVHRRDWRPCPALFPPTIKPTKPASRFWYAFAEAVQHEHTFLAFVEDHPAEFPHTLDGAW